jgi:hypothetical protein
MEEVPERWRKLHNEKIHYVYSSPNIKLGFKRWLGHVERMEDYKMQREC